MSDSKIVINSLGCWPDWLDWRPGIANAVGDHFNIEVVCPGYMPECQWAFTWHRDERGVAIVSGYDPENDPDVHWLCGCGNFETGGGRCSDCGNPPPWGDDFDDYNDYDEEMDFGDYDPYEAGCEVFQ